MAESFDRNNDVTDAWIWELKLQIRTCIVRRNNNLKAAAAATGLSYMTIRNVMFEDNVRHHIRTLHALALFCDIRLANISAELGRQPGELRPLTPKQEHWLQDQLADIRAKKKKE